MTNFTRVTDNVDDVLASQYNALIDGLQQLPGPGGFLINGKISVSVASNNLTVAIKTLAGTDPSATDPVAVRIGNVVYAITAALSVTKNAATNWCNAGSTELATKEIDYFVYLGFNATDGKVIGFSRIPYVKIYSQFSVTTTNEKYAGISTISNAAASDEYVVIGRFAATLSAGAGYTWTVPTFTALNLVQYPTFETRALSYLPVYTGYTGAVTTSIAQYQIVMNRMSCVNRFSGTSNATGLTFTLAMSPANTGNGLYVFTRGTDNSVGNKTAMVGPTSTNVMTAYTDAGATAWTNVNTKGLDGPIVTWDI